MTLYDSLHSLLDYECLLFCCDEWRTKIFCSHLELSWRTSASRLNLKKFSHIVTDGQSVSKYWCRAPSGAHDQIFVTVWQLRSCFRGAPSLTRGRVCLFYMLWPLPAQSFLGPSPLGPYFTVSDLRVPFSSPPTTRRVTVEVFDPASTRVGVFLKVKIKVTLRLTVSQAVSVGVKPDLGLMTSSKFEQSLRLLI
jgi:hypothetical protein